MSSTNQLHTKLTKNQKDTVALLSIGSFLEYFDLMLYVHMASILNDLFFPKTDPTMGKILAAFAFCSTFVLRPVGGFIIGYIGDKIGRRYTIFITTLIMAGASATIASTGTYAEIGITATYIILACRMAQGFSSLGEAMGALLYLTECLKSPTRYVTCTVVNFLSHLGSFSALFISFLAVSLNFDWRIAFWIGAGVALVGIIARSKLRETPEFVDYRRRMKIKSEINNIKIGIPQPIANEKVNKKMVITFMLNILIIPISVYVTYSYIGNAIKSSLGLGGDSVITQNLKLVVIASLSFFFVIAASKKYHPLKMGKLIILLLAVSLPFFPYILGHSNNLFLLLIFQIIAFSPLFNSFTNIAVWFKYFPIAKRFTIIGTAYGVTTAAGYAITSFSVIPLQQYLSHYCLWVIYVPVLIGFYYSLKYMEKHEKERGAYDQYPYEENKLLVNNGQIENKNPLSKSYDKISLDCTYAQKLLNNLHHRNQTAQHKVNIPLIEKAMIFTKYWHRGQMRNNKIDPFYSHPFFVADIVSEYFFKTDVIIAALLHDVVEDTKCTYDKIVYHFNNRIAHMVKQLTKFQIEGNDDIKKVKLSLEETAERFYKSGDFESFFIKQIDRLHNLYTIDVMPAVKQEKIAKESARTLLGATSFISERLNINSKFLLENKMIKLIRSIFKHRDKG